jgi:LysM repeat protein
LTGVMIIHAAGIGLTGARAADKVYVVQSGDTLQNIADDNRVKARDLINLNKLKNPDRIYPGQRLRIPPRPDEPREYTVGKGDTLSGIAAREGVSASILARYNRLSKPDCLSIGQKILIPTAKGEAAIPPQLTLTVKKKLDRIRVSGKWKNIIIHHSATPSATIKALDDYHRKKRRMKNGLAYHFVIGNGKDGGPGDGEIYIGDRWKKQIQGGHLSSEWLNRISIGICLIGNFQKSKPSRKQIDRLEALVDYLLKRCRLNKSAVKTHTQIHRNHTLCPGKNFPTRDFMQRL